MSEDRLTIRSKLKLPTNFVSPRKSSEMFTVSRVERFKIYKESDQNQQFLSQQRQKLSPSNQQENEHTPQKEIKTNQTAKNPTRRLGDSSKTMREVDILVIGGGPASLGLMINAFKTNRHGELLNGDSIAIIDEGISFGGGALINYGINSNTSAFGFLKCTLKRQKKYKNEKKQAKNKVEKIEKQEPQKVDESKITQEETLSAFRELITSSISSLFINLNKQIVPLSFVGVLLNFVGNHLLHYVWQIQQKRIFYPMHKAVSVQLMANGVVNTKVLRTEFYIDYDQDSKQFQIVETSKTVIFFKSKALVLASGACQQTHPDFNSWFPNKNVVSSDKFLTRWGFVEYIKQLKQGSTVVIIGGSHSGFSCAWMLLNGAAEKKFDVKNFAQRKGLKSCPECCSCKQERQNKKKQENCNCVCKCFGYFKYQPWPQNLKLPQDVKIKILYRDKIRVFFKNQTEAQEFGYKDYDLNRDKDGYIYSFTGLRGDAKSLYQKITTGEERRVKLIKAITPADQLPYVNSADLVIWACGYQTKPIPIYDHNKIELKLSQRVPNTQFDVDSKCRVILSNNQILTRVFACGVGYPVRTKDGANVSQDPWKNPRADSFSLYMNAVADIILKSLVPKRKLMQNKEHFEILKDTSLATYEQIQKVNEEQEEDTKKIVLNAGSRSKSEYQMSQNFQKSAQFNKIRIVPQEQLPVIQPKNPKVLLKFKIQQVPSTPAFYELQMKISQRKNKKNKSIRFPPIMSSVEIRDDYSDDFETSNIEKFQSLDADKQYLEETFERDDVSLKQLDRSKSLINVPIQTPKQLPRFKKPLLSPIMNKHKERIFQ